eukprot:CAMPEP_0170874812 /NCGR_PEP_ID=MMETSP0734-20130129/28471_1 /TAXON_ID=186038 /ORGANISM="Fragilariopsis kerguelensis, Strain L26-C5" /LENGTH=503 /DNA_ID=CAMNT_0011256033 /DNA_START=493 /DNA_END=2002 /DNA_ORIENTATION=-
MEMMIAVYYLRCFLLALLLSSFLLDEVQGHSPGTAGGLSHNPGNAYHTDSLGGNVWMFDNFYDAVNALVPWEFNGKALGTDQVVDSIVEGATFTRPFRGGVETKYLQPFEFHLIHDEGLSDFPLLDPGWLDLKDDPKTISQEASSRRNVTTKSDHVGFWVTDTYLAEQLLTTLALNRFPDHVLDRYTNRTVHWTGPYWMTNCTVQLYVLMPYDYIFEFDIAYYDRYREKLPALNLPPAKYWKGANGEWSLEESMKANELTPRTEFNTYLCNATWNATLGMSLEQAGTNGGTGAIVDNRYGNLANTVREEDPLLINMTEEGDTDNLMLVSQYVDLPYDNNGTSYAVDEDDGNGLDGSYACVHNSVDQKSTGVYSLNDMMQSSEPNTTSSPEEGTLVFTPVSGSNYVYNVEWSSSSSSAGTKTNSKHNNCTGVAMKLAPMPMPKVDTVSMGLFGKCLLVGSKDGEGSSSSSSGSSSTMFLNVKVHREGTASKLLLDGVWTGGDGN